MKKLKIPTDIKCNQKVKERRQQLIDAGKELFLEKGFHKTTTRDIAKKANLSFGAIYEYVGSKEDILYLLIEQFYEQLNLLMIDRNYDQYHGSMRIVYFIRKYLNTVDQLSNEINIIYRDLKSLPAAYQEYVQSNETEFLNFVKRIIIDALKDEGVKIQEDFVVMLARNLVIQGHMWAFQSWDLTNKIALEQYFDFQSRFFINAIREQFV